MRDAGPDGPDPTVARTTLNGYCFPRRPKIVSRWLNAMGWSDAGLSAPCAASISTNE
jgi:hypothetical protein